MFINIVGYDTGVMDMPYPKGIPMSEEAKAKQRETWTKKKAEGYTYVRKSVITEDERTRRSAASKLQWSKRKMTPAHLKALQDGLKRANVWANPEVRAKHSSGVSKALKGKSKSLEHRMNISRAKSGLNPNWKYGEFIDHGYRLIRLENGEWIQEHRVIMERHLGRKLESEEVVHHINGDKLDNRIENLALLFSQGVHMALHLKGNILSEETRKKISITRIKNASIKRAMKMFDAG